MGMQGRKYIATASFALSIASFCSFLGAEIWYSSTRPTQPHPELGRIYAHHLKLCATVYLTPSEATGLSLLPMAALAGMIFFGVTPTKERTRLGEFKEFTPTKKDYKIFWIAIFSYTAIIIFVGPSLTHFAVSHGVILTWATDYGA
jgi:hypothetical protein